QLGSFAVADGDVMVAAFDWLPIDMRSDQPAFCQKIMEGFWIKNRVRLTGVSERVGDQTAYPQGRVRRPADVRDRASQSILIIRARVVGVDPAESERIIELTDFLLALDHLAKGAV